MSAQGRMKFVNVDRIEMSLTITMPVANWRNLKKAMADQGFEGSWQINDLLNKLLAQADKELWAMSDKGDGQ